MLEQTVAPVGWLSVSVSGGAWSNRTWNVVGFS
jgi:hypothetical protein